MRPFGFRKRTLRRGDVVGPAIEKTTNFHALLRSGFIRALRSAEGETLVPRCYITIRRFMAGGKEIEPGTLVDLRGTEGWRNESSLLETGFIRLATVGEVEKLSAADGEGADANAAPAAAASSPAGSGEGGEGVKPATGHVPGQQLPADDPGPAGQEGPPGPPLHKDAAWLREQYWDLGRTTTQMAEAAGVPPGTISKQMEKLKIPRRPRGRRKQ